MSCCIFCRVFLLFDFCIFFFNLTDHVTQPHCWILFKISFFSSDCCHDHLYAEHAVWLCLGLAGICTAHDFPKGWCDWSPRVQQRHKENFKRHHGLHSLAAAFWGVNFRQFVGIYSWVLRPCWHLGSGWKLDHEHTCSFCVYQYFIIIKKSLYFPPKKTNSWANLTQTINQTPTQVCTRNQGCAFQPGSSGGGGAHTALDSAHKSTSSVTQHIDHQINGGHVWLLRLKVLCTKVFWWHHHKPRGQSSAALWCHQEASLGLLPQFLVISFCSRKLFSAGSCAPTS